MKLAPSVFTAIFLSIGIHSNAQFNKDSLVINNITENALLHSPAYESLKVLCKDIGHRLSGSAAKVKANQWAIQALYRAGADTVWLQPVLVPKWERGKESMVVRTATGKKISLKMISLGNSEGTNGKLLTAPIIVFQSLDDLKEAKPEDIKGKVVFLNSGLPQKHITTFDGYGESFMNRYLGPNIASEKGAVAYVMRSLSTGIDDYAHTGVMSYKDGVSKIPAIALGNSSSNLLNNLCKEGSVTAKIRSNCRMKGEVMDYNIIGELSGETNNYITVGGHLDSWDVGEGAHDDGAGCVQSIEVLRLFKHLNIKPKNTLRVVLFANEENGA
ncbi:MAG TPA: M28 family peptidase [Edaphocola sp.]|nr:M28 family peptidase [Edaphocola sp.]